MVGTIKQQIYIKAVPKGMTMVITGLNLLPPSPPEEWKAVLFRHNGKAAEAPFTFDPTKDDGHLGEVKLYGSHPFPSNSLGARLEILWELRGEPTPNAEGIAMVASSTDDAAVHPAKKSPEVAGNDPGAEVDATGSGSDATEQAGPSLPPPVSHNARYGRFIVETTKWGYIERPDYVYVLYQVGDKTPLRVISPVAATIIDMPEDALFVIGANASTEVIGINATQEKKVADELISYLVKGIFEAHSKAFGWVRGLLLPFP